VVSSPSNEKRSARKSHHERKSFINAKTNKSVSSNPPKSAITRVPKPIAEFQPVLKESNYNFKSKLIKNIE
jgi:hypothetical protein